MLKVGFGLLLGVFMAAAAALVTFPFLWAAWNHGVHRAFSWTNELGFFQAFWFDFGLVLVGNALKGTTVEMRKDP